MAKKKRSAVGLPPRGHGIVVDRTKTHWVGVDAAGGRHLSEIEPTDSFQVGDVFQIEWPAVTLVGHSADANGLSTHYVLEADDGRRYFRVIRHGWPFILGARCTLWPEPKRGVFARAVTETKHGVFATDLRVGDEETLDRLERDMRDGYRRRGRFADAVRLTLKRGEEPTPEDLARALEEYAAAARATPPAVAKLASAHLREARPQRPGTKKGSRAIDPFLLVLTYTRERQKTQEDFEADDRPRGAQSAALESVARSFGVSTKTVTRILNEFPWRPVNYYQDKEIG